MKLRLTILVVALIAPALILAQTSQPQPKAATPPNAGYQLKMTAPLETAIVCVDLERMLKFYTEVIGLKKVADAETTPEMSKLAKSTPYGYRIVRLQTPNGERVKLIQPRVKSPRLTPVPEWVYERGGMAFITFIVEDMTVVVKQMKANNAKLVSDGAIEVRPGVFAMFVVDPEGNYVEFVRYPDIAAYRPDLYKK
jgi:catechol 2,3-dioxygenase-like lactoylglutathione lyase family enzyme